ncbi:MAG TPA: maleylpyruvate isomerase family mycothiol-dependent enzyme [Acidimicrobiales bacterium]
MQISPRYDTDPIVRLDGPPGAVGVPLLRQRRRLADTLSSLSPEQWETASRCEGWRVQDVVAHLTGTDQFWTLAIDAGLAGRPTRFLATFDPKATPASMVERVRGASPADALAAYLDASGALCASVEALDDAGWNVIAETPVGHVAISALAHHALWDSWVHERDVLVPLGIAQVEEADEVVASLRYVAALSPAFALQSGTARAGALALVVERPAARVVVAVDGDVYVHGGDAPDDALVLTGGAVDVLEALSVRASWREAIPQEHAWLLAGLSEVFEAAPVP